MKIILFATSPQDAIAFCEEHELDFDQITWVRHPDFLDQATQTSDSPLTNSDGVAQEIKFMLTEAFYDTEAFPAAHAYMKGK